MRRALALVSLWGLVATVGAEPFAWPADAPVSVAFGGPMAGASTPGVILDGGGLAIRSTSSGDISFVRGAIDQKTRLPSSLGSTIALEGDDQMVALYGYLPSIADPDAKRLVAGALLGTSGSAGILQGDGFLFSLYDRKSGRWVNPRVFLPKRVDERSPAIRRVGLAGSGKTYFLGETKSLPQGQYSILIDAAEQETGMAGLVSGPPWYLRVVVNGQKVVELQAEIARVKNGILSFYPDSGDGVGATVLAGLVQLPPRLFSRGKVVIEVLVADFSGNQRSAAWTIQVE